MLIILFLTASGLILIKPAFGTSYSAEPVANSWTEMAQLNQARGGLGVIAVNGAIYAIGGSTGSGLYPADAGESGNFVGTNEEYNISTNTWTYKAPMPVPRDYFAIAAYKDKIYCIGGHIGNEQNPAMDNLWGPVMTSVNEVYDTATNAWSTKAPMPVSGMYLQARVINGGILVTGAGQGYLYDPVKDSWTKSTALPFVSNEESNIMISSGNKTSYSNVFYGAAAETTGVAAPRRIYVVGLNGDFPPSTITNVYDPETDTWTNATAMPTLRQDFGLAVADDLIYAIGGLSLVNPLGYVTPTGANERYTPIGYGTPDPSYVLEHSPPRISLLSPLNQTYSNSSVPLLFNVDKVVCWMGYSLNGEQNVTITGNDTITNLPNGLQNITVYANDTFGNMGCSTTNFTVAVPHAFSFMLVAVVSVAVIVVFCGVMLLYFKKHKRKGFLLRSY
jgi:hypothetical protein